MTREHSDPSTLGLWYRGFVLDTEYTLHPVGGGGGFDRLTLGHEGTGLDKRSEVLRWRLAGVRPNVRWWAQRHYTEMG